MNIFRIYPKKRKYESYPSRYTSKLFDTFENLLKDTDFINDYKKWKLGINPTTNRKIQIYGELHYKISERFRISYKDTNNNNDSIIMDKLENINREKYLADTEKIISNINNENALIKNYNDNVDKVIEQINQINNWDDFIIFEGKKYGYPNFIKNETHIKDNCFGKIIFIKEKTKYYFNDRPFCNYSDGETTYLYYICDKCKLKYKEIKNHKPKGTYESKNGFWWK